MPSSAEQDVQMTNEKSIVNPYANPSSAGRTADPGMLVNLLMKCCFYNFTIVASNKTWCGFLEIKYLISSHEEILLLGFSKVVCRNGNYAIYGDVGAAGRWRHTPPSFASVDYRKC